MPHGLTIDTEGNVWVTDVGLHQVIPSFIHSTFFLSFILSSFFLFFLSFIHLMHNSCCIYSNVIHIPQYFKNSSVMLSVKYSCHKNIYWYSFYSTFNISVSESCCLLGALYRSRFLIFSS